MVDVNIQNKTISVNVSSSGVSSNVSASGDTSHYYSEKAREWAISNRIVDGVDYSSKYYAQRASNYKDEAQNISNTMTQNYGVYNSNLLSTKDSAVESINTNKTNAISEINSAGKSYDNLTHKQITNCLLEIPQNIKLELNNGVLTLKAGSVVIVPNGFEADGTTPKFDYVDITSDRRPNISVGSTSSKYVYVIQDNVNSRYFNTIQCFSGATAPTGGSYLLWYDTTNNLIKESQDGGATWLDRKFSFPVCLFSANDNQFTSIDQIFNGFGYIGSTIWCDKDVKGLIPHGRNEDGTLKNIEFTTQKIRTYTNTDGVSGEYYIQVSETGIGRANKSFWKHYAQENLNKGDDGAELGRALVGSMTLTNDVISNFQSELPFRAVDYADYKPAIDSKVSKSGDTMTGTLSFNKTGTQIIIQTDEFDQGVAVDSIKYCGIQFNGKNGNRFGKVEGYYLADGTVKFGFNSCRYINGANRFASVLAWIDENGGVHYEFPKCTTKATTTSSATSDRVAVVVQNYVNGTSWYRVWSDGWKEQGGQCTAVEGDARYMNITYLKAFSNTNYTLTLAGVSQGIGNTDYAHIYSITASGARLVTAGGAKPIHWYACGY